MKSLTIFLRDLAHDDGGASLVEYTLLLALITAILIGFIVAVSDWAADVWDGLCTTLDQESTDSGGAIPGCTAPPA